MTAQPNNKVMTAALTCSYEKNSTVLVVQNLNYIVLGHTISKLVVSNTSLSLIAE